MKVPNTRARSLVENRQAFKGSNTFAEHRGVDLETYVVYSYGYHFPIFVYKSGHWYENQEKYSVTTSKQMSQLRPAGVELEPKTTQELKNLI